MNCKISSASCPVRMPLTESTVQGPKQASSGTWSMVPPAHHEMPGRVHMGRRMGAAIKGRQVALIPQLHLLKLLSGFWIPGILGR